MLAGWVVAPAETQGQSRVTYVALTDLHIAALVRALLHSLHHGIHEHGFCKDASALLTSCVLK